MRVCSVYDCLLCLPPSQDGDKVVFNWRDRKHRRLHVKGEKKLVFLREEIGEIKKGKQGDKTKKAPDFSVSRNKYELAKELQESLNKKASEIGVSITRFSVGGTKRVKGYYITTVSVAFTGDVKGLANVLENG